LKVENHCLFLDDDHQVSFIESPNQGTNHAKFMEPRYLMMHYTADPRFHSVISWFKDPRAVKPASAHLVIDVDGSLVQMVRFDKIAWHAGTTSHWQDLQNMNQYSIGIELVNAGKLRHQADGKWIAWNDITIPNDEVVILKHKHENKEAGWHIYSEKQISTAIDVARALHKQYSFKDILGHEDVRKWEKVDPGPAFPMADFKTKVLGKQSGPILQPGSQGEDVKRLQRLLVMLRLLDFSQISGTFGPETLQAVKDFQQGRGLTVDGKVGPQTWGALPPDPDTPFLKRGDTGPTVMALQQALKKYNPVAGAATDPGTVDGKFGPRTENAVRAYQGERGVVTNGIVGDQTWWVPAGGAGATLASLAGLTTV
jgi:N-acetylmuramoyl-L-alanine amidase